MKNKIAISASVLALLAAAQANAADVYNAPAGYKDGPAYAGTNWAGFYAGINGGYGWAGNKQFVDTDPNSYPSSGLSPRGGFGGGQIGYNWQGLFHPNLVASIEADIQGSGIGDTGG